MGSSITVHLADRWRAQSPNARGALLMCLATIAFASMHAAIKHVSDELHPYQIAFLRNLFGLAFLVPLLWSAGFASLRTEKLGLHALRGLFNIGAMLLFFSALASETELATITALGFAAPVFTAVLSVLVLGERFRLRRWAAIAVGFLGMLIILRPGIAAVEPGMIMVVSSAALWACAMIVIKIISRTDSSVVITAYMGIFLGAFSLIPALYHWQWPGLSAWSWLIFIGFTGSVAQVSISESLKVAEPTAVLPFDFLKLIWTALIGAWVFAETPDVYTWIGAAVIFAAGLYIAHRENRVRRPQPSAPENTAS